MAKLERTLHREANALFRTDEYERFFGTPFTRRRARFYMIQRATFMLGRRACWAINKTWLGLMATEMAKLPK